MRHPWLQAPFVMLLWNRDNSKVLVFRWSCWGCLLGNRGFVKTEANNCTLTDCSSSHADRDDLVHPVMRSNTDLDYSLPCHAPTISYLCPCVLLILKHEDSKSSCSALVIFYLSMCTDRKKLKDILGKKNVRTFFLETANLPNVLYVQGKLKYILVTVILCLA